ncbi:MAG: 3'-5' exonuclease domain-containing protein 2 [Rhodocyclaceae bacterium]|nr:3'-5' exonuclease domain-containing protein 2 [Rhodocyclaceae bacterium]
MPLPSPTKSESDLLEPFDPLPLERIVVPAGEEEFAAASEEIRAAGRVGFDTESKPTFAKGEASEGPHIVQFATTDKAFIFQLHRRECLPYLLELLASKDILKVGFGLKADHGQIQHKLGVRLGAVLDLNDLFRQDGYASSMGVRAGVALAMNRKFHKSKKVTTTNWAAPRLTEKQLLYAANDAYAALRVLLALDRPRSELPITGMNP